MDLSFVCILSHGSSSHTIVDINGQDVQVEEEIIKEFDNKRCPQLIGKLELYVNVPTLIFIFQMDSSPLVGR